MVTRHNVNKWLKTLYAATNFESANATKRDLQPVRLPSLIDNMSSSRGEPDVCIELIESIFFIGRMSIGQQVLA